jgi:hypothetical protein
MNDYRLLLFSPSIGEPLLADGGHIGVACPAVSPPHCENYADQRESDRREDRVLGHVSVGYGNACTVEDPCGSADSGMRAPIALSDPRYTEATL